MLAESGTYQAVYLNDLTIFYLRCRFACNSLPLRNLRLLWICADLLLPAKAALLGLAAICALSIAGDYTAPKQDSRAAADNRSRGKSSCSSNAATPRAGIPIPEAQRPFEPETANLKPFSRGIKRGILSFVKESIPLLFAPPCLQGTLFLHRMWKSLTPWCDRTKRPRGGSARCRWRTLSHSAYPGARCG